jgi:hypothetical protein
VSVRTSLTVEEASKMLDGLVAGGNLELLTQDGAASYVLPGHDRYPESTVLPEPGDREGPGTAPRVDEPLSERELALLASGRTDAEIAGDLFVALGDRQVPRQQHLPQARGRQPRRGCRPRVRAEPAALTGVQPPAPDLDFWQIRRRLRQPSPRPPSFATEKRMNHP